MDKREVVDKLTRYKALSGAELKHLSLRVHIG